MMTMIPKIKFRKMTIEENIDIIKWFYFRNNDFLDINYYMLMLFPELKNIDKTLSKKEVYKKIEEVVIYNYKENEKKIEEEVKRYDIIWSKYNDIYMNDISDYLNINWSNIDTIDVSIGLIPVFPRNLDNNSFSISIGISEYTLIETCAHETLHFIWFQKLKKLFPECSKEKFNSPYLPWQYSEMVVDPILNSEDIKRILPIKANAYDSFYGLKDGKDNVMDNLKIIYKEQTSIENKIINGYDYLCKVLKNNKR